MKKIITMLMGVVMASSMFIATAYADETPYCSISADKEGEINIGDEVVFSVSLAERTVTAEVVGIQFDTEQWECTKVVNASGKRSWKLPGYNYAANPEEEDVEVDLSYSGSTVSNANSSGKATLSFMDPASVSYVAESAENVLKVTLKAKVAAADAKVTLIQQLDSKDVTEFGTDTVYPATTFIGDAEVLSYTIKAAVEEPTVTWNEADASWAAPAGKKAIWWPFDFEAGAFPGHVFVEITDGTRTEEIGIGANADYDVNGAVSFAVAVILGADVDATNFNCVVK